MRLRSYAPAVRVAERPTRTQVAVDIVLEDWWFDNDGTRYHLIVVPVDDGTLVCFGPDDRFGDSWWVGPPMNEPDLLSWDYVREKLHLRDGDAEGVASILSAATGWDVRLPGGARPSHAVPNSLTRPDY